MPGQYGLALWFVVLFWVLRLGLPLMLLVMTVDVLRRPESHFTRSIVGTRIAWVVENLVLLLVLFAALLAGLLAPTSTRFIQLAGLIFVPFALIQGLRYLLTLVYPSPKRLAERQAAQEPTPADAASTDAAPADTASDRPARPSAPSHTDRPEE